MTNFDVRMWSGVHSCSYLLSNGIAFSNESPSIVHYTWRWLWYIITLRLLIKTPVNAPIINNYGNPCIQIHRPYGNTYFFIILLSRLWCNLIQKGVMSCYLLIIKHSCYDFEHRHTLTIYFNPTAIQLFIQLWAKLWWHINFTNTSNTNNSSM